MGRSLRSRVVWIMLMIGVAVHTGHAGGIGVDRYVSNRVGSDAGNDCTRPSSPCATIQHALDLAGWRDVVKVHASFYEENILVQRRLNEVRLEGGWTQTFHDRYEGITTYISGLYQGPVFQLRAESTTVDLTIDRFELKRGQSEFGGAVDARAFSGGSQPIYGGHIVLAITDSLLRVNGATLDGGAIRAIAVTPDVGFNDNSVDLILAGNEFRHNTSGFGGGAISVSGGRFTGIYVELTDNFIHVNGAGEEGGALRLRTYDADGTGATVVLKRNVILDNDSGADGGGIALISSGVGPGLMYVSMENNIVANNVSDGVGAGIFLHAEFGTINLDLLNDTISGNDTNYTASSHGVGIHASTFGGLMHIDMTNTITKPNHRHPVGALDLWIESGVDLKSDYSIMGSVGGGGFHDPGTHNLSSSPSFVDSANGDYHLLPDSAGIDAALCATGPRPGTSFIRVAPFEDFEGDPRPGVLTFCDIGADEYVPEPTRGLLGAAASICLAGLASRRRRSGA